MVGDVALFWVTEVTYGQGFSIAFSILFHWRCTSKSCISFSSWSNLRGVMMSENERLFRTTIFWRPFFSLYFKCIFEPKSGGCGQKDHQKSSKRSLISKVNRCLKILRLTGIPCFGTFSETALKIELSRVPVRLPTWFRATPKVWDQFFLRLVKKSVTERPPESICITYTNSETKNFLSKFFFLRD